MLINKLIGKFKNLTLTRPIQTETYIESGYHIVENKQLNISGIGKTKEEAVQDFADAFIETLNDLVNLPEDSLHIGAIELKNSLLSFIK